MFRVTPSTVKLSHVRIHHLVALGLIYCLAACGSAPVPSPTIYHRMVSSNEHFTGEMNLSKLTPTSSFKEAFTQSSLGRSISLNKETGNTLNPAPPCVKLLPDRVRDDYRDRLPQVFDDYLLTTLKDKQEKISFDEISFTTSVDEGAQLQSVISGHVGISRILSFVDESELKYFDRCCKLTGTCGENMISKLYEVDRDVRYISKSHPTLVSSLLTFEGQTKSDLNTISLAPLAKRIYLDQAKAEKRKPQAEISHIEYRKVPKAQPSPFTKVNLSVSPAQSKIKCKKKKSKTSSVVEFSINLNDVENAQEALGYEITTSKQWVDLSLAERKRLVKVGSGIIACYPGPDAFTNPDDRCPAQLVLTAFPPSCPNLKGNGDFEWKVKVGVYAPGDEEKRIHHQTESNTIITKVYKR